MNTTTNPSPRTEHAQTVTAGAEPKRRDHSTNANAPYETPQGAEHRTFELTVTSVYDLWLLTTFTGYAGEDLWVSPLMPFRPLQMKLTYRQGTLELPEVRWLVDRIFESDLARTTLRCATGEMPPGMASFPRPHVLAEFAEQLHKYLDSYDLAEMVKYVSTAGDHRYFDVASRTVNGAVPE